MPERTEVNTIQISGLVLAAGLSSRMGEFKPLLPFRGKTLIENTVDSLLENGVRRLVLVTGYRGEELEELMHFRYGERVTTVRNENYAYTDMMQSIRIGCRALPACDAFFLLPGDMPVVREHTFARLLSRYCETGGGVVFPTLEGYRKHPPLIDSAFLPEIQNFREEGGLRRLWEQHEKDIFTVAVDDEGVWVDVDTPEDYRQCRKKYENVGSEKRRQEQRWRKSASQW